MSEPDERFETPDDLFVEVGDGRSDAVPPPAAAPEAFVPAEGDCRLYQPDAEGWEAHIMRGSDRLYCYAKQPGQDYFHLIVPGEVFVQKGDEKLCLMCAVREGVLTTNRLHWQFPWRKTRPTPIDR
jgi:hypothetical protein